MERRRAGVVGGHHGAAVGAAVGPVDLAALRQLLVVVIAWILQGVIIQYVLAPILRRPGRSGWTSGRIGVHGRSVGADGGAGGHAGGNLYGLVPEGRWRQLGKWLATALVVMVAVAKSIWEWRRRRRVVGVVIGVTVSLLGFRLFAPNEAFPVTYRRGRARIWMSGCPRRGHPPVAGPARAGGRGRPTVRAGRFGRVDAVAHPARRRSESVAVRQAMPAPTCGPTAGTSSGELLYGRLEDEKPFNTVRRLVQQEDYMLHKMPRPGCPRCDPMDSRSSPRARVSAGHRVLRRRGRTRPADVDDRAIDDGLALIRRCGRRPGPPRHQAGQPPRP